MRYDAHTGVAALLETRIASANATQRAGRAGRVRRGECYHLFMRREEQHMDAQQVGADAESTCQLKRSAALNS